MHHHLSLFVSALGALLVTMVVPRTFAGEPTAHVGENTWNRQVERRSSFSLADATGAGHDVIRLHYRLTIKAEKANDFDKAGDDLATQLRDFLLRQKDGALKELGRQIGTGNGAKRWSIVWGYDRRDAEHWYLEVSTEARLRANKRKHVERYLKCRLSPASPDCGGAQDENKDGDPGAGEEELRQHFKGPRKDVVASHVLKLKD